MRRTSVVNILILAILFSLPVVNYLHVLGVVGNKDVLPWMLRLVPAFFLVLFAELALYRLATFTLSPRAQSPFITLVLGCILQALFFGAMMSLRHHSIVQPILYNTFYLVIAALVMGFISFFVLARVQRLGIFSGMNLSRLNPNSRYVLAFAAGLCAFIILGVRFWSPNGMDRKSSDGPRNVVLITVDCLRFDALSCTAGKTQTPNIDDLYKQGVFFENYCSHAPYTHPSLTSIMTSLEAPFHKVRRQAYQLDESFVTIPEVLTDNGYACYCPGDLLIDMWGLGQGFQRLGRLSDASARWLFSVVTIMARVYPGYFGKFCFGENSSMWSTLKALEFLRQYRSQDFFLWIHYFNEPHSPYYAPTPFRALYNAGKTSWVTGSNEELHALNGHPTMEWALGGHTLTDDDLLYLTNLYRAEVSTCDTEIGMIVNALKRYGLFDDMMIVLTADHGEDFSDRGHFGHTNNLYTPLLHVPLIVKLPSESEHARVSTLVVGQDIGPTILNYCGAEIPEQFHGESMFPLDGIEGGESRDRWCYSETTGFGYGWPCNKFGFSYTSEKYKYICVPQEGMEELYDLVADPTERNNILDSESDIVEQIRNEVRERFGISDINELIPKVGPRGMKYQRERLRQLGYIE